MIALKTFATEGAENTENMGRYTARFRTADTARINGVISTEGRNLRLSLMTH